MDTETFRRHAHALVDWMADYMAGVEEYPVRASVAPGSIAAQLPEAPPEQGEPFEAIFKDFTDIVLPGMTHWQHPSFFAYFPANASPPSVLAEMLTSTLAAQCMLWQTSPAATEMEGRMMEWLARALDLPQDFRGSIQASASEATLSALLMARERATGDAANKEGLSSTGQRLAVYCSEDAHSSVEKGARVAGFGADMVRKIPVDENRAVRLDALEAAIRRDVAAGITPACVVACIGGTGTGGMDDVWAVSQIARSHGAFVHVDAAWAGSALILPEWRWMADGLELADSFVFNPHKWLLTNFDCSAHYVRDPEALMRTLSLVPEYLRTHGANGVTDYSNWSVPLGRRFRALKLWFVLRSYGLSGLQTLLRRHIELAKHAHDTLAAEPGFEITSPLKLALFTFRHRPEGLPEEELDAHNERLLTALNDTGKAYFTQTRLGGRYVIRFQVGQTNTETRHVNAALDLIRETARGFR
ncbi:pyridoxal phosphate-dependent decarboxylase family protein [Pedomonas mirosovicensis]|uniref:pyridoxal phosphate-dependent decarboxylase family protein n=1 Tax=Pedomonas mirosovicensis TaxID=2908641 RepID=UPI00216809DF|nr:aminotransferase class V-fold PLP-dependent enzyme [Pedomonas mirosovicensis]MCH8686129.1 aminotransferase class V-fold PLP-dependent enzyme [Pedomonas mirosovicensis]